eukprot:6642357-Prymnesium_polylepis.1
MVDFARPLFDAQAPFRLLAATVLFRARHRRQQVGRRRDSASGGRPTVCSVAACVGPERRTSKTGDHETLWGPERDSESRARSWSRRLHRPQGPACGAMPRCCERSARGTCQ